jgi:hypothetical protein
MAKLTLSRRILPLITENDTLSMIHGSLTAKLASIIRTLGVTEKANLDANEANREISRTLLTLAKEMKVQSTEDINNIKLRDQVNSVEKEVKEARRRMQTLKGILSAMIVGSGINWAVDEVLCELVMDDEDEG